jgi:putative ABC transport system permease protein
MTGRELTSRLHAADLLRLGTSGLRARPVRAILSALGIAIGIAAMIAVVGISASSQARLNEQLSNLGTNLLRASAAETLFGDETRLPADTVQKVARVDGVEMVAAISKLDDAHVYRSELSDPDATAGLVVMTAGLQVLDVTGGSVAIGDWLNEATQEFPAVVLGSVAAERLGIVSVGSEVWLGGHYFTVVGILDPVVLAPELDTAALVGEPVGRQLLDYDGSPTTVYERSENDTVERVRSLLPATVRPQAPEEVAVSRPSDALAAQNAADDAFTGILVGLGSVALLVGGIGVANTMIISVIERRREVGLRRALGATRRHIGAQFLAEALLLSALGGVLGALAGAGVTAMIAWANGWPVALPPEAVVVGVGATVVIGAAAGLYPATRAARTPPTAALASQGV